MRDEAVLTLEAVTRQSLTNHTRLVFEKRAKLSINGPPAICEPLTSGMLWVFVYSAFFQTSLRHKAL